MYVWKHPDTLYSKSIVVKNEIFPFMDRTKVCLYGSKCIINIVQAM
jgi:5'(3')-deoxyribonucleotidase